MLKNTFLVFCFSHLIIVLVSVLFFFSFYFTLQFVAIRKEADVHHTKKDADFLLVQHFT